MDDLNIPTAIAMRLTDEDVERARRHLMRKDPRLGVLIRKVGRCRLPDSRSLSPFGALVRAILAQQLSNKAAATIHQRVLELVGGRDAMTAAALLAVPPDALRAAGVSRPKVSYLCDLAERVADGRLDLDTLEEQSDEEVIAAITAVRGLGRWSAEMFLMFRLHRPDVLPVGDLGIVNAVKRAYRLRKKPTPDRLRRMGEAWKPYRSVASWYLWRSLGGLPGQTPAAPLKKETS